MQAERTSLAPIRAQDFAAALLKALGTTTGMKLQKLLYYIQSWHLARFGSRAFSVTSQAPR
jgi:uncharacterized phage-associated protein